MSNHQEQPVKKLSETLLWMATKGNKTDQSAANRIVAKVGYEDLLGLVEDLEREQLLAEIAQSQGAIVPVSPAKLRQPSQKERSDALLEEFIWTIAVIRQRLWLAFAGGAAIASIAFVLKFALLGKVMACFTAGTFVCAAVASQPVVYGHIKEER